MKPILFSALLFGAACAFGQAPAPVPSPSHQTPPPGIAIPDGDWQELTESAAALGKEIAGLRGNPANAALLPDVEIFYKAVHDALTYDEFFNLKQVADAKALLAEGMARAKALSEGKSPWTSAAGLVVRGYRSKIDQSVQPYGLIVPASWKPADQAPRPLYSWFHGRSENLTELAFLSERMKKNGEFTPDGAFVLHLYGRFCNASKFAGETDFMEALADTRAHYPIDGDRLVAVGFSMGGASVWHIATHHAGLFVAASPGAGFAETAQYNKVFAPGREAPPWWEQQLWHLYDATDYAENLANTTLIAYSGELDGQKQSADIMEKAAAVEGVTMERLIGPQTAHKYEPQTKKELDRRLAELVVKGCEPLPARVRFTTYTLRYNKMKWIELDGLEQHWERAQVEAEIAGKNSFKVTTKNVSAFSINLPVDQATSDKAHPIKVVIDAQELTTPDALKPHFRKTAGKWALANSAQPEGISKHHGLTGPIDDAFNDSFIFVRPTGKALNEKVGGWVKGELERAIPQWRTVFRGEARVKDDTALTEEDIANSNLVLWGDPSSNAVLAKVLSKLPIQWNAERITLGKLSLPAADHAPVMIYPNPLNPRRYVVINSSFTFREGSSQTNSQQTPKLPDWAIVDLNTPPNKKAPGAIVDAGFFNERWQ
ncbi:MAG: hypothetical protein JWL90_2140 [Chthoniobacteraceae bacterium]|nr:hypothetical protein [Chthoniobacteraceae bacterium]